MGVARARVRVLRVRACKHRPSALGRGAGRGLPMPSAQGRCVRGLDVAIAGRGLRRSAQPPGRPARSRWGATRRRRDARGTGIARYRASRPPYRMPLRLGVPWTRTSRGALRARSGWVTALIRWPRGGPDPLPRHRAAGPAGFRRGYAATADSEGLGHHDIQATVRLGTGLGYARIPFKWLVPGPGPMAAGPSRSRRMSRPGLSAPRHVGTGLPSHGPVPVRTVALASGCPSPGPAAQMHPGWDG